MAFPTPEENLPPRCQLAPAVQGLRWGSRPYEFLRECASTLGDSFTIDLGPSGIYAIFAHPDSIRTIFTADPAVLHAGKGNAILRPFLGPNSLLLLEDQGHQKARKRLVPAFYAKRIEEHGAFIVEATLKNSAAWKAGDRLAVHDTLQQVSIDVILRAALGVHRMNRSDELRRELLLFLNDDKFNLALISQLQKDFSSQSAWVSFRQRFARIDALVREEVAYRRSLGAEGPTGILDLLLSTAEAADGSPEEDLRDEFLTLVVAGYETTATALAWCMYWVHSTPHVKAALVSALGAIGPNRGPREFAEHPYLDAVCKEVLRIHPVIPVVAREIQVPFAIDGFLLPPKVTVSPCIYLAHHRAQAFPEPDAFLPERFIGKAFSPYEYLPFGGGARRCIGMNLALYEMKIVLGTILSHFELELVEPARVRPVRRSVTIAPSGGPLMLVKRQLA